MVPAPMAFNAPTVPCFVPVPLTISIPNVTPMHKGAIDRALLALQVDFELFQVFILLFTIIDLYLSFVSSHY